MYKQKSHNLKLLGVADGDIEVPNLEGALHEVVEATVEAELLGNHLLLHPWEGQQVRERHVHRFLKKAITQTAYQTLRKEQMKLIFHIGTNGNTDSYSKHFVVSLLRNMSKLPKHVAPLCKISSDTSISRDSSTHLLAELALVINVVRVAESLGHAPGGLSNIDPVLDEVTDRRIPNTVLVRNRFTLKFDQTSWNFSSLLKVEWFEKPTGFAGLLRWWRGPWFLHTSGVRSRQCARPSDASQRTPERSSQMGIHPAIQTLETVTKHQI